MKRLGGWLTALIYGGLAVTAFRLATGGHEHGDQTQSLTARAMAVPFGRVLVAAIGVGVFAYAVWQGVVAYRKKFARHLALDGLAARNATWVTRVCQFGIVARAVVFALMGAFLVQAAVQYDPNEALGLGPDARAARARTLWRGAARGGRARALRLRRLRVPRGPLPAARAVRRLSVEAAQPARASRLRASSASIAASSERSESCHFAFFGSARIRRARVASDSRSCITPIAAPGAAAGTPADEIFVRAPGSPMVSASCSS